MSISVIRRGVIYDLKKSLNPTQNRRYADLVPIAEALDRFCYITEEEFDTGLVNLERRILQRNLVELLDSAAADAKVRANVIALMNEISERYGIAPLRSV